MEPLCIDSVSVVIRIMKRHRINLFLTQMKLCPILLLQVITEVHNACICGIVVPEHLVNLTGIAAGRILYVVAPSARSV